MIKAVVFDVGNVVVKWEPENALSHLTGSRDSALRLLKACNFAAWNLELDRGRSWGEAMRIAKADYPDHYFVFEAYRDHIDLAHSHSLIEIEAIILDLKKANIPMYGLTNACREAFDAARVSASALDELEGVIVSGDVAVIKPDPEIYRLTIDTFELDPNETLFVDDKKTNCDAAVKIGFQAHQFLTADALRTALRRYGCL